METLNFNSFKKQALSLEPISQVFQLSEIQIVSGNSIGYKGLEIKLSNSGISDLLDILGLPKTFLKRFETLLGNEARQALSNLIKNAVTFDKKGKAKTLTMKLNPITREIVGFAKTGANTSFDLYFSTIDRVMNSTDMELSNLQVSEQGNLTISMKSPKSQFNVGGLVEEDFQPGLTISNNFLTGIEVDSYLFRLICSNGMIGKGFQETVNFGSQEVLNVFNYIDNLKAKNFMPYAFSNKVITAINCRASLNEVSTVYDKIAKMSYENANVNTFIPRNTILDKFKIKGVNASLFNEAKAKNAVTDISVWDLVNGMTDVASHEYGLGIDSASKIELQKEASLLFSKNAYDTQNLVSVSL